MKTNFWNQLKKPFSALAPMEDVTDTVFRQMVGRIAPPDVYFTEFTNVDGIVYQLRNSQNSVLDSHPASRDGVRLRADFAGIQTLRRLMFSEVERPIVAQIWGNKPENFYEAAGFVKTLGFDGIDINMACPQRDIMKCGGGSALIGKTGLVKEIIEAVKKAAPDLPISVKTRLGNKNIITEEWIDFLLEQDLDTITVHLRTAAELSRVPAHWEEMGKIVKIRGERATKIIGNGDIKNYQEGVKRCADSGCDGFMIGRGVLNNPATFDKSGKELARDERFRLLGEHVRLWEETWGEKKDFQILKKFVKAYINGFEGAAEIRSKLMEAKNMGEMLKYVV
jgi:tRNA-dihydrouridine synthase